MTRRLHVLMLMENGSYPLDGRPLREARALLDAGHAVSVICPRAPGQMAEEDVDGVRVHRYRLARARRGPLGYVWEYGYSLTATFALALRLHARRPFDVVHAHNPPDTFVLVALFFKPFGARFVFDHHDLVPEMYAARFGRLPPRPLTRLLLAFERLSLRTADAVISTNASYRDVAIARAGLDPSRVTVVRNGPELESFAGSPSAAAERPVTVGYLGSISAADGVDRLLRALAHLVHDQRRTDFDCVIAGDGEAVPGLRRLAADLALEPQVRFVGRLPRDAVAGFLETIDIGTEPAPSNAYNDRSTMVKVMEYMAAAKPIVAFDLPENRFSADGAAVFVPPGDERAFAGAIADLMDAPARRVELGARGRRRIEDEGLAWAAWAPELTGVYSRLL